MFLLALVAALGAASACSTGSEETQFVGGACSRSQVDDSNGSEQNGSSGRWGPGVKHAEAS
jgi:hypothetical protein